MFSSKDFFKLHNLKSMFKVERTVSNMFTYLIIDFNFNLNLASCYLNESSFEKVTQPAASTCSSSSLRLTHHRLNRNLLIIENMHKILDIDLSNWMLEREIKNCVERPGESISIKEHQQQANNVIKYKFPNGFKLKRRKKLFLVAGEPSAEYKRSAEIDVHFVRELKDWGCGLQIITKLVNQKNIIKLVNYKCFKNIWIN